MAPKAQQKRPGRLLNKTLTARKQALTRKNCAVSPLLRLPPEVRNRIYRYVLGGRTLHINYRVRDWCALPALICEAWSIIGKREDLRNSVFVDFSQIRYSTCFQEKHDGAAADRVRGDASESTLYHYAEHHLRSDCGPYLRAPKFIDLNRLNIGFLRTCRQIYLEAALLPYVCNSFSFSSGDIFEKFIDGLVPVQRRTIRSITLGCGSREFNMKRPSKLSNPKGLKEVTYYGLYHDMNIPHQSAIFERLGKLSIEKARVCMTSGKKIIGKGGEKRAARNARNWSRAVEEMLERHVEETVQG